MLRYLRVEPVRRLDSAQSDVSAVAGSGGYADSKPKAVLDAGFGDESRMADKRVRCAWSLGYGSAIIRGFQL